MAYATVDELAAALRVAVTAANTPALQACLDAAAVEIDHYVDAHRRRSPDGRPAGEPRQRAARRRMVEGQRRRVRGDRLRQTGALQAPRNGFRRHAAALVPLKQQWGVA